MPLVENKAIISDS